MFGFLRVREGDDSDSAWLCRTVEVGGPEKFRLDDVIRQALAAWKDPREVVADPRATYYGVEVSERTIIPDDGAQLGQTRFADWLKQPGAKALAATH